MPLDTYRKRYTLELNIDPADTSVSDTFDAEVDLISVISPDIAIWLDPTDAESAGDGSEGGRMYLSAGVRRFIPWHANSIEVINAVGGETGYVYIEGWLV